MWANTWKNVWVVFGLLIKDDFSLCPRGEWKYSASFCFVCIQDCYGENEAKINRSNVLLLHFVAILNLVHLCEIRVKKIHLCVLFQCLMKMRKKCVVIGSELVAWCVEFWGIFIIQLTPPHLKIWAWRNWSEYFVFFFWRPKDKTQKPIF